MLKNTFFVLSTAFWLAMTSTLIHREFFQLTPVQAAYEVLPMEYLDIRQEYRAVYLGKERVGFNFTVLDKIKEGEFELRHQSYLSFLFLGQEREMLIREKASLDEHLNVKDFTVKISSGNQWTQLKGQVAKNNLNLVIESPESQPVRNIVPLNEPIFLSEAMSFIWTPDNLKPGKKGRIKVWSPLSMNFQDIEFHVVRRESISYEGKATDVFLTVMNMAGIEIRSWISPEGIVLKEESPTGLVLQKEDAWKIFDAMRQKRSAPPDLPNLFSIASNMTLENPGALSYLKVRVQTPKGEETREIQRGNFTGLESLPLPVPLDTPELSAYLQSTPWVQSDDPAIVAQTKSLLGEEKSALMAALRFVDWTHHNILPVPTISLPKATEVLASKKGDCNEYTALFTAFARAAGIPAKMVAGLVYQNGRFFYHAWPEIYLGRWIGVDPTFGQAPVDVTHIPLVEGGIEEQVALASQLGRIKVQVLEAK